ncbi:spore germination protein [Salipaludibacillus sp. HK11]|uniref:spore germination protein n=1 Tax=Salipaludibacillus sp. HK11 TaxID=3394320 RepID=UPI0039FC5659
MSLKNIKQTVSDESFETYLANFINNKEPLPTYAEEVTEKLDKIFNESYDFSHITIETKQGPVQIYYFQGMINEILFHHNVLQPLQENDYYQMTDLKQHLHVSGIEKATEWTQLIKELHSGNVLLHVDNSIPLILQMEDVTRRSLTDPSTEQQVYGTKIGLIENIETNVSLVRKMIKDPRLKTKEFCLGTQTQTKVAFLYMEQYMEEGEIEFMSEKLKTYNKKHLFSLGDLSNHLSQYPFALFPQHSRTERLDNVCYELFNGKMAILVDNSTFCLITPTYFMDSITSYEDETFFVKWSFLFTRLLRFFSVLFGAILPAIYVSLVAFHPELLPTTLALTIAESRSDIPLPAQAEALFMMMALDILVEASIRLPSFVGQTIGIVGGLVIGTAAVEAGIVSNTMVIIIAFTAISTFTLPSWETVTAWRTMRYLFLLSASVLGLYGYSLIFGLLLFHSCKIDQFGRSYMYPISPFDLSKLISIFFKKDAASK